MEKIYYALISCAFAVESSLLDLPEEVKVHIFEYLSPQEAFAAKGACKDFTRMSDNYFGTPEGRATRLDVEQVISIEKLGSTLPRRREGEKFLQYKERIMQELIKKRLHQARLTQLEDWLTPEFCTQFRAKIPLSKDFTVEDTGRPH